MCSDDSIGVCRGGMVNCWRELCVCGVEEYVFEVAEELMGG